MQQYCGLKLFSCGESSSQSFNFHTPTHVRTPSHPHRPPGHHAEANRCMGFCIFNNVAVAAQVAIEKHGLQRYVAELWKITNNVWKERISGDELCGRRVWLGTILLTPFQSKVEEEACLRTKLCSRPGKYDREATFCSTFSFCSVMIVIVWGQFMSKF